MAEPAVSVRMLLLRPDSKIWVVLPAYNEEKNLGPLLGGIGDVLEATGRPYEILVVDDGSTDSTREVAMAQRIRLPVRLHSHDENLGLGRAIGRGLWLASGRAASSDVVVTLDADNTHPPHFIPALVAALADGNVAIASRFEKGSRLIGLPRYRRVLSLGGSLLFRALFPKAGVKDFTCGFRAYRASAVREAFLAFGEGFVDQAGFQSTLDILLKLHRLKHAFREIPFTLRYDLKQGSSKMKVGPTVSATLSLLFKRRLGLYGAAR